MTKLDLKKMIVECLNESDVQPSGVVKLRGFGINNEPDQKIQSKLNSLENKYKNFLDIYSVGYRDHINLKKLVAKKDAPVGTGSAYMTELTRFADENGLMITLTPAEGGSFGMVGYKRTTSYQRLVNFYKRFGFKSRFGTRSYRPDISDHMFREPLTKRLHERNDVIGNYRYYGFTSNQEEEIHNKIFHYHQTDNVKEKETIKREFETLYQYLVGRNTVLNYINIDQPDYKSKNTPEMDVVNGVISGIPPEDIKNFVEITKGDGGNNIPTGYKRDMSEPRYIKIVKVD